MSIISFKALQQNDLDLLKSWFNKPHVKQWWYLSEAELNQEYCTDGVQDVFPFVVSIHDTPMAFIQYYYANKAGPGWWPDEMDDDGTIGIDIFIAEETYINRGWGRQILGEFIIRIFDNPLHQKIILDVSPDNHPAIRCYEKVGFKWVKQLMTPKGLANMMELKKKAK